MLLLYGLELLKPYSALAGCGEEREREALQPLIALCQAEILTACLPQDDEAVDTTTPTPSLAEWRPNVPAHVERVQQARRHAPEIELRLCERMNLHTFQLGSSALSLSIKPDDKPDTIFAMAKGCCLISEYSHLSTSEP